MALTIHRRKIKRKRIAIKNRDSGVTTIAVGATLLVGGMRPVGLALIIAGGAIYEENTRIIQTLQHPYAFRHMFAYNRRNLNSYSEELYDDLFRFPKASIMQHINYLIQFKNFPAIVHINYNVLRYGRRKINTYTYPLDEIYLMFLRYISTPIRHLEVAQEFGRTIPEISRAIVWFHNRFSQVSRSFLQSDDQPWFDYGEATNCADALSRKGCRLDPCLGFVDGVNRGIADPIVSWLQTETYSGYKKRCGLNYAGCALPNGMGLLFLGPSPGRRHDAAVAAEHGLYDKLERLGTFPNQGFRGCFNADSAYPLFWPIIPLYGNAVTQDQKTWNSDMSSSRVSVEWLFGQQAMQFSSIDWFIRNKVLLSPVVESHLNAAFLTNLLNTRFPNIIAQYFDCQPPSLEKYLNVPNGSLN